MVLDLSREFESLEIRVVVVVLFSYLVMIVVYYCLSICVHDVYDICECACALG